ncbi:hypothetical protein BJ165DRAFT_1518541 [Panaeolus papilionaceus]|nr:hypothetical protein BJ165DRAFT_1518541 [Panaeolus papilionaceus]
MKSTYEIAGAIIRDCLVNSSPGSQRKEKSEVSEDVWKALCYTEEDVTASKNYVLICCYQRKANGIIKLLINDDDDLPDEISDENVKEVFNVVPGYQYGMFENLSPEQGDSGTFSLCNSLPKLLITHKAYVILKQAAPALKPHSLLLLNSHTEGNCFPPRHPIDYGPVKRTRGLWTDWIRLRSLQSDNCEPERNDVIQDWRKVLSQKGDGAQEAILNDAWRGRGNLWCLVTPDRFPIVESASEFITFDGSNRNPPTQPFTRLPLGILVSICKNLHPRYICALASTCTFIRGVLLQAVHQVVRAYITQNEPWFLPVGSFDDMPRGGEEFQNWVSEWGKLGHAGDDIDSTIPWLAYRRSCSHSFSMWNRARIWGIACQMEELATQLDYIN